MAACGDQYTLVVTHDGALWAYGLEVAGRLGLGRVRDTRWCHRKCSREFELVGAEQFGGSRIVAAAAGGIHSAAMTEDGALWTWGGGVEGQLGHGDEEDELPHVEDDQEMDGYHLLVPTVVKRAGFGGGRIGRCRGLSSEHALAFAIGTHGRLGGGEQTAGAAATGGGARRKTWTWV